VTPTRFDRHISGCWSARVPPESPARVDLVWGVASKPPNGYAVWVEPTGRCRPNARRLAAPTNGLLSNWRLRKRQL